MEILQIQNLTFHYPDTDKPALDSIHLSVDPGEFAVICGESGCGKSTLLKLLKREIAPFGCQTGEILYNGMELAALNAKTTAGEIGLVRQDPDSQIVTDTVWHELAFGLESLGFSSAVIRRRVAEMASYFGIEDWFHQKTSELSGGQKQLLNLASVMAMQPKLLLLDEPTAQLDPIAAANFIGTLQKINRELGLTILLVEHRLEEVLPVADRVLLMDAGRLLYAGPPANITAFFEAHPSHPVMAGLPAAMRIFGALDGVGESPLTVRDGRRYITTHYENRIKTLPTPSHAHQDETAVELKEVWFRYRRDLPDVMRGVSLRVYRGEHFCLLGGNGSGKTTTLSVIAGLQTAYRGKVMINGKNIAAYTQATLYQNNMALLPQNPITAFLGKTVREDLAEICRAMGYTSAQTDAAISEGLEKMDIAHLQSMHPYDLSGGEQQKAALTKMLLLRPKILLLDEPTKGIDANAKLTLATILRGLKEEGVTIITVTHDVEFAAANADRCGMFFDGELVSVDGPVAFFSENNFYTTAANRMTRGYYQNAILCDEVVALCRENGRKEAANATV